MKHAARCVPESIRPKVKEELDRLVKDGMENVQKTGLTVLFVYQNQMVTLDYAWILKI